MGVESLANLLNPARRSTGNTEKDLARRYNEDWAITSPYLRELLGISAANATSNGLIDAARRQIQRTALGTDESINQRQLARANVNLTPSQQLAMTSANNINAAANNTANLNVARLGQYEQNTDALNRLIATTNAMKKGSASTLNGIAQNEASRAAQRSAMEAQKRQSTFSTIGTLAGLGLGIAFL